METYLIRHTTPAIEKGICYGQADIPLAETFETEWIALKEKLPEKIDAVFSSPLSRCNVLGQKISKHFELPLMIDNRLMEMNFGAWELKAWEAIEQKPLLHWMNNYTTVQCPEGESYTDVVDRVKAFINDTLIQHEQKIIIVTHGGVIKCFDGIVNNRNGMDLKIGYGEIYYWNDGQ